MNDEYKQLFNVRSERTIACPRATYVHVTRPRSWLPDPMGGVVWLGYDNPVTAPHIPFCCGIESMPKGYMIDGRSKFRRDCAWWAFRSVGQLCYLRYQDQVKDMEHVWKEIETKSFTDQPKFETKMLAMYKKDPAQVRRRLRDTARRPLMMPFPGTGSYWMNFGPSALINSEQSSQLLNTVPNLHLTPR